MSAKELGAELAGAIDSAFKAHVPNPEKFAAAQAAAIEQSLKKAGEALEGLHKNFLASQQQAVEKWTAAEKSAVQHLEQAAKSIEQAAAKIHEALSAHIQQMEKTESSARDQLKTALTQHVEGLSKASSAIAAQLDKIMQLEKDIQQVLHIQQVVDGSIKAVSSAEEFKATLAALRKHLEQSDALIREATKPRTIRLIEQEA
ncbi:MAG: hypothetical protein NZ740_05445 [Kiritimatiellae bacterium]|nr:hypothetical protein [Kiritimatiellia bacterium]MDW8458538.1 hypothetical protein [Verrucomicrobiota bacterium]